MHTRGSTPASGVPSFFHKVTIDDDDADLKCFNLRSALQQVLQLNVTKFHLVVDLSNKFDHLLEHNFNICDLSSCMTSS